MHPFSPLAYPHVFAAALPPVLLRLSVTPLVTRRFIVGPSEIKSAVIPHTMDPRLGKVPRE